MNKRWKTILLALLGVVVDILPTILEDISKEKSSAEDHKSTAQPVTSSSQKIFFKEDVSHPLQHLKRRATD